MAIIHVLTNDGSPLGVTLADLWGNGNRGIGIGGSEYALLTMCEAWHKAGHSVKLYNNPMTPNGSPFEQLPIRAFNPKESRDILIIFRSPNDRSVVADGYKVWWSCDQYTVGNYSNFAKTVHKIVGISPFHARHFQQAYNIQNMEVIDLPIRIWDLDDAPKQERVSKRFIFTSVPDRGLHMLWRYWPQIKMTWNDSSLVITSDYRLWGTGELNEKHRRMWLQSQKNEVQFIGAVKRDRLISEMLQSDIQVYPCIYDELFCISLAESQCAGVYTIASNVGALETTAMGTMIAGNPQHVGLGWQQALIGELTRLFDNPEQLEKERADMQVKARERFNINTIMKQWDERVFNK